MPLVPGDKLGPYEILASIGKGGMGEVFRARDTRLGRDVAIKISSREFNDRFEREARAISSLNHPNICTLFDVGPNFLVMELVEGESLSTIIGRGPLPPERALQYATQIVDALSVAHSKGVVHRDLKPGNIIITRNGAKVLDFGLAKLTADLTKNRDISGLTETVTEPITRAGAILGTLYYMAPEQVEGKVTDERSDIFSFGVVLYEMLTGQRPFNGDTQAAVLASLMKDQPPPMAQAVTPRSAASIGQIIPRSLERLVRKCLEKKPDDRWQSARDLKPALELIDLDAPMPSTTSASVPIPVPAPRKRWLWPALAVGVLVILGGSFGGYRYWQANSFTDLPMVRQDVSMGQDIALLPPTNFFDNFAISPDGTRIVYLARPVSGGEPRLYTRRLDRSNAIELPETESAVGPFFSPDGEWLGFASNRDRKVYKISVDGGARVPLMDLSSNFQGGSWEGNIIVVAQNLRPLVQISDSGGGQPTPLGPFAEGEQIQASPSFIPGTPYVLFGTNVDNKTGEANPEKNAVYAISVRDGKRTAVLPGTARARYVPSHGKTGHLLYPRLGALYAVPFDPTLKTLGPAVPLLSDMQSAGQTRGKFSVSATGTLIYQKSTGAVSSSQLETLQWLDAAGKLEPLQAEPGDFNQASISPDGTRVALSVGGLGANIRVLEWKNGRTTSLTFGEVGYSYPVWTPDGRHVVFTGNDGFLYSALADGSGQPRRLLQNTTAAARIAWSFSPKGDRLAFTLEAAPTQIWTVPISLKDGQLAAGTPEQFLNSEFSDMQPQFSPDGKWITYRSNGSGLPQVYVRPASGQAGQWVMPTQPAGFPRWSRTSQDLLYAAQNAQGGTQIMAVHYTAQGDTFVADKPRVWLANTLGSNLQDLAPDGKRVLVIAQSGAAAAANAPVEREIVFLQNFFDELRRRAPAGK